VRLFEAATVAYSETRYRDAVPLYEEVLVIVRELEQTAAEGVALNNLGICYYSLSDYTRAIDCHEQALAIQRTLGDLAGQADSLNNLGNCYYSLSDYSRASDYLQQALAIRWATGDGSSEAVILNNLGNCYYRLSDYARAIDYLERALAIKRAIGDRAGEAAILNNLGTCYYSLCDYTRAIDYHERAQATFVDIGDRAGEASSLNNLGNCYYRLSDYSRAISCYKQALPIEQAIGRRSDEADSLNNVGNCYYSLSDYTRAIDYFEQALAIFVAVGNRAGEANSLGNLGNCYNDLSDYARAILCSEWSLAIEREIGNRAGEAANLNNLGVCYHSLLDYARATDYHEQALAIRRAIGDRAGEAMSLGNLGNCRYGLSDYTRAIDYHGQALTIFIEVSNRAGEAASLDNLGNCYDGLSDYARAIDYYDQALTLTTELGTADLMRRIHRDLGYTYRAMGEWEKAAEHYQAAIAIVESIRGNVDDEALRQSYLEGVRTLYQEYLSLLLELGRKSETLLVAERLRARTFLDSLYQAGLSPEALSVTEAGIRSSGDESLSVLDAALLEHAVSDGRESLLANEAVLEYMVTDDGVYLWVVTIAGVNDPIFIPYSRQDLIADVRALREMIEATEPDPITIQSRQMALYRTLVQPGLALLGDAVDTLVFIPSGPLWYVPFSALGTPYLVERYTIGYLPSLASLTSLAGEEEQTASRGVIALANPTLSPEQLEELGMTGTKYQYDELEKAALGFANCYVGQEGTVYTESDAEEPRAYELEGAFDVAIYACHGLFNPYFPLESKLLLAPGVNTTREDTVRTPEDGDYSAKEVLLTDHRGVELAVLAACETLLPAFGNLQSVLGTLSGKDPNQVELTPEQLEALVVGDEVVGLARAFLSSGAQSVLGTLWQANPGAVKALLVSMCQHYQAGLTWAQALCAAQRELIKQAIYADVWSWAPYQLIGRWR
jgi:tetratricopeptide (TPR) repeat protein